jgi:hypothetical protein
MICLSEKVSDPIVLSFLNLSDDHESNLALSLDEAFVAGNVARCKANSRGEQQNACNHVNKSGKRNCDAQVVIHRNDANGDGCDDASRLKVPWPRKMNLGRQPAWVRPSRMMTGSFPWLASNRGAALLDLIWSKWEKGFAKERISDLQPGVIIL